MSTTVHDDRSAERLREAWQLHELGFYGAAVVTARLAIEQAMLDTLGLEDQELKGPTARQLAGRLHSCGRLSGTKRKRLCDVYSDLSRVAHGKQVDEHWAYYYLVEAGKARDFVVEPSPAARKHMQRRAISKFGLAPST